MSSDYAKTATISVARMRLTDTVGILSMALALVTACAALALAQDPRDTTRADIDQWLAKYGDAKPDFKPGDVLTVKDFERIRPFMMPGFVEQFKFPRGEAAGQMQTIRTHRHDLANRIRHLAKTLPGFHIPHGQFIAGAAAGFGQ